MGLDHVPDWGHYVANILEKCYAQEDDFKTFNAKMGAFKQKKKQGEFSYYSPPTLSVKIRFMNYIPFLEWANIMLSNFKDIPKQIVPELQFLQDLKPFITEMTDLFYTGDKIGILLKKEGINPTTEAKTLVKLQQMSDKYPDGVRVKSFVESIKSYFNMTMPIYYKQAQFEGNVSPFPDALIASSDIIESIFGKFKHRSLKDPKRGFSINSLVISLFCRTFSPFDVFEAMTKLNINHLHKWKNDNLIIRQFTSFRNIFKQRTKKGGTCNMAV